MKFKWQVYYEQHSKYSLGNKYSLKS